MKIPSNRGLLLVTTLIAISTAQAGQLFDSPYQVAGINCVGMQERHIIAAHCHGELEVDLGQYGRADCVDEKAVYEYGFAETWKNDIGQILSYGMALPDKRMILRLISRNTWESYNYMERASDLIDLYQLPIEMKFFVCAHGEAQDKKRWFPRKNIMEWPTPGPKHFIKP